MTTPPSSPPFRVGVLGFGKLGRFIVEQILSCQSEHNIELSFIWNRSPITDLESVFSPNQQLKVLQRLKEIAGLPHSVDLIVEVCHPEIVRLQGEASLKNAHFLIGSPVALMSHPDLEGRLLDTASAHGKRIFVATGALWGAADVRRLAKLGLLELADIEMKFSPRALRLVGLEGQTGVQVEEKENGEVHYSGSVRQLAAIAPNNVNTMACLALSGLGGDRTKGVLISDPNLTGFHKITVTVKGKPQKGFADVFQNTNVRLSPTATEANVTSQQTFYSFWYSILEAKRLILNSSHSVASKPEVEII